MYYRVRVFFPAERQFGWEHGYQKAQTALSAATALAVERRGREPRLVGEAGITLDTEAAIQVLLGGHPVAILSAATNLELSPGWPVAVVEPIES